MRLPSTMGLSQATMLSTHHPALATPLLISFFALLSGCGGPPPAKSPPSVANKIVPGENDAKTLFNRETTTRLSRYPIRAFDGRLEGEVEAVGQPTLEMKHVDGDIELALLSIPLDKGTTADCALRMDGIDLGPGLARQLQGDITEKKANVVSTAVEVVAVRDTPTLVARHILSAKQNGREVMFDRTMAATSRDGFSLICDIASGGYAKTFVRVVSRLGASMAISGTNANLGVDVFESRSLNTGGYCRTDFETRSGAGNETKSCNALSFDKAAGWRGISAYRASVSNKAGEIESVGLFMKIDPNPSFRYGIKRTGKRSYSYTLTGENGETRGDFSAPAPVRREASYASSFRDVLSGKKPSVTMVEFDSKPGATISSVVTKKSDREISLTSNDTVESCLVDAATLCEWRMVHSKEGELRSQIRRLFTRDPQ